MSWGGHSIFLSSMFSISMCLVWYGSQSEAAGNRCLWLRTILRQPVFPLWVVGSYFLFSVFVAPYRTVSFLSCFLLYYFCVQFNKITWTLTMLRIVLIHPIPHQKRKTVQLHWIKSFSFSQTPNRLFRVLVVNKVTYNDFSSMLSSTVRQKKDHYISQHFTLYWTVY